MDPSPTGFYRVVQKVSDVIPVLGIMSRLPFLFSWASSSVVAYVGHRPTHILPQSHPRWPRGFYRVHQKLSKNFKFLSISRFYVSISQQQLQLEACDPTQEKILVPPLSTCRIYIGVSPTTFYRLAQKVSDTIPILRITAIAPEPTTVSVCAERRQVRSNM